MATNEPNKPDNVINIDPGNKTQAEEKAAPDQPLQTGGEAPAPKKTAEPDKAAPTPAPEEKALAPGKNTEPDKTAPPPAPEEKAPEPAKQARRGRPAKADKADKPEKAPKEKPPAEQDEKKPRKARAPKQQAPAKEETPAPEPEQPPQPREAPRPNGKDEIVSRTAPIVSFLTSPPDRSCLLSFPRSPCRACFPYAFFFACHHALSVCFFVFLSVRFLRGLNK